MPKRNNPSTGEKKMASFKRQEKAARVEKNRNAEKIKRDPRFLKRVEENQARRTRSDQASGGSTVQLEPTSADDNNRISPNPISSSTLPQALKVPTNESTSIAPPRAGSLEEEPSLMQRAAQNLATLSSRSLERLRDLVQSEERRTTLYMPAHELPPQREPRSPWRTGWNKLRKGLHSKKSKPRPISRQER